VATAFTGRLFAVRQLGTVRHYRNDRRAVRIHHFRRPLDADKSEGNSGITSFTFTISRSGYLGMAASVDYAVRAAHPSKPGENYPWRVDGADFVGDVLPSGTVPFLIGESTKTITIDVVGDTTFEFDEPFFVVLSDPTISWALGTSAAVGTILSDENRLAFAPASPLRRTRRKATP